MEKLKYFKIEEGSLINLFFKLCKLLNSHIQNLRSLRTVDSTDLETFQKTFVDRELRELEEYFLNNSLCMLKSHVDFCTAPYSPNFRLKMTIQTNPNPNLGSKPNFSEPKLKIGIFENPKSDPESELTTLRNKILVKIF